MKPPQEVEVTTREVSCNGGGGPSGHPRVFLNLGDADTIDCPYCGCRFVLQQATKVAVFH